MFQPKMEHEKFLHNKLTLFFSSNEWHGEKREGWGGGTVTKRVISTKFTVGLWILIQTNSKNHF